jgi:asparaginyl-tRNA synthetase
VVKSDVYAIDEIKSTGTCVVLEGELRAPPEGATGQVVELHATKVLHVGPCDAAKYPIAKKKISLEFLREKIHLRTRTNTIAAVARIRSALSYATHTFFNQNGFLYVHTPCITQSDCEGAGEMFQVTTLLSAADEAAAAGAPPPPSPADVDAARAAVTAAGDAVKQAKAGGDQSKDAVKPAVDAMMRLKSELGEMEKASRKIGGLFRTPDGKIDYMHDFFSEPTFLTVSGQLNVETYACAMTSVYTFGPTFRAENSNTTRHLAEFWMIEPEIAFADLQDDMQCAEDYVRFCLKYVLEHCLGDLEFMAKMYDKECVNRVKQVAENDFGRVSYTEAIDILIKAVGEGKEFVYPVEWGIDLATEHERYLAEEIFKKPVIVYNYPKDIKAFYMRLNDDNKTVAAMDVLVPKVGELIGGSQREERIDVMERRMGDVGIDPSEYEWYMDLRRYGSVVHSGFGLGFERLILFCTGMENIRDVIPYPRWPGNCT